MSDGDTLHAASFEAQVPLAEVFDGIDPPG